MPSRLVLRGVACLLPACLFLLSSHAASAAEALTLSPDNAAEAAPAGKEAD